MTMSNSQSDQTMKEGDNMTQYNREPLRPTANVGDIITIKGYGIRTFKVESLTHERYIDEENDVDEIYYDCTCEKTFEPMLANQEDVTVVSRAGEAVAYPKSNVERPSVDDLLDDLRSALLIVDIFGESEEYRRKIDDIKAQLKDRTEGGEWK